MPVASDERLLGRSLVAKRGLSNASHRMGIQVFKQLAKQRRYALGALHRLQRRNAPEQDIQRASQLLEALSLVMDHQGLNIGFEADRPLQRRPKRGYFPVGAYRGDVLRVLRAAERPMRITEILDELCVMHQVTLSNDERRHAAIKLAQGNDALIQQGLVVRATKAGPYRSAACTYELPKDCGESPEHDGRGAPDELRQAAGPREG